MFDLLWTLFGFSLACYATYLLIHQAVNIVPSPAPETPASPKREVAAVVEKAKPKPKEKKVDTVQEVRMKEVMKEYQKAKETVDKTTATLADVDVQYDEEIERLQRVVKHCLEKQATAEKDRTLLVGRISKLQQKQTELDSKITRDRKSIEEQDESLKMLQDVAQEAQNAVDEAREESEQVEKLKRDTQKKLKKHERDASNLSYKSEGMKRRVGGIERENDFLRREIEYRLNRVEERRAYQENLYNKGRKGSRGGKGGKGNGNGYGSKGRGKAGDAPHNDEHYDARVPAASEGRQGLWALRAEDPVAPAAEVNVNDAHDQGQEIVQRVIGYEGREEGAASHHWADDDVGIFGKGDDAPRAPPTPPPPTDAPEGHVNDLLQKAMANPIDQWMRPQMENNKW